MSVAPRCESCKFYVRTDSKKGECHGAPPQTFNPMTQSFMFPWVRPDDWCGLFKAREDER